MSLLKRFGYFFIGITFGSIMSLFFFQKKGVTFDYGPNARTLKSIRTKKHQLFSEQVNQAINNNLIDSVAIAYALHNGDVDFSKSNTDLTQPCQTYWIDTEMKDRIFSLLVKRCDSSATVLKSF